MTVTGSRILALGHYQPGRVVTNDELAEFVDTNDEWIRSRVGIRTRHVAARDETVDAMAAHAAAKALAGAGVEPEEVDLVQVATCTAIDRVPNMASRVAVRLGIPAPAVIDVNVACSGFSHALAGADHAIRAGAARRAVVIAAEKLTGVTDWQDRTTAVLTGDGAGAAVVAPVADGEEPGIGPVVWGSSPEMGPAVRIEGEPAVFAQEGQAVYRWAVKELPPLANRVLEVSGVAAGDLDAIVLHQANLRIVEPIARSLRAPQAVVATDVTESGNTSAASVPLAFSKLVARGEIASGARVLLFGFGGNLSYAGQVVRCP